MLPRMIFSQNPPHSTTPPPDIFCLPFCVTIDHMSKLVDVGRGHSLSPEAAASWERMKRAGMPDSGLTSSTRSLSRQWDLYNNRGKPGWPRYVAHPNESKHVWRPNDKQDKGGRAVDVSGATRTWMISHAAKHGWYRPWPDIEPWHFEYVKKNDKHLGDDDMPTAKEIVQELMKTRVEHTVGQRGAVDRKSSTVERLLSDAGIGGFVSWKNISRIQAELRAIQAVLNSVARETGLSHEQVQRTISQAVDRALKDIEIVLTTGD